MTQPKTWTRATQITGKFPEDKYGFTQHLKQVGDYVMTYPMAKEDAVRVKWAAHQWAYRHECRVSHSLIRRTGGLYSARVMLVDKNRIRDYK